MKPKTVIQYAVALPFFLLVLPFGLFLRLVNEVTTRAFGYAFVICPQCGTPGVVETRYPKVIQ